MSDQQKPTDTSSTDSDAKELDADQLENVAGGLLPAVNQGAFNVQWKWAPDGTAIKIVADEGIAPALKK
jgi:hypothetical protein